MNHEKEHELYNEIYREIASALGIETAIEIFRLYKGQQITFPTHLYCTKKIRKAVILEFDGRNIRELSAKYGYSQKTITRIIKKE